MGETNIEWTDATWNPIVGCSRASTGCEHCYAERMAVRLEAMGQPAYRGLTRGGHWTGETRLVESALAQPLHWRKPRRVFVCSMGDLFHESVLDEWIDRVFAAMALAPTHTFQILTKRTERMRAYLQQVESEKDMQRWANTASVVSGSPCSAAYVEDVDWPLPNVWLGVTAEDQQRADERLADLLATPAAVRFVSYEPALGPVDFSPWLDGGTVACEECGNEQADMGRRVRCEACGYGPMPTRTEPVIDWLIAGGESGPGARPCDVAWIRSVVEQCKAASVPAFVKQLGASPRGWCVGNLYGDGGEVECDVHEASEGPMCRGRCHYLADRKGGDPSEWPEDLRIREWPEVRS